MINVNRIFLHFSEMAAGPQFDVCLCFIFKDLSGELYILDYKLLKYSLSCKIEVFVLEWSLQQLADRGIVLSLLYANNFFAWPSQE